MDDLAKLRAALAWPRGKELTREAFVSAIADLEQFAAARGAEELAKTSGEVVRDPDSPDLLYELGYGLIEVGAQELAASVLWRCLSLVGESEEVVCELCHALETSLAHADAFALLAQYPGLRERSFLPRYLYAYNAAMTGRLDALRAAPLAPDSREAEDMAATIAGFVARADRVAGTCSLDQRDLRGWHYVLTGGVLLHQSPYGFDEPMHGRYAWLADSAPRIATGIDRLGALIRPLNLPCVYAPDGRDHEILAEAIAQRLGLPRAPWPAVGIPAPGLVAMYDHAMPRGQLAQLVERRPDQVLFVHASKWTEDARVAADVTTLLYQALVPPWGEAPRIDPVTREASRTPPDERPAAEIAADIAASTGLSGEDLAADEPDRLTALVERAWPPEPGRRGRMWAGGPVPSSRFV